MKPLDHSQIEGLLFYQDPTTQNYIGAPKADPFNQAGSFVAFGPRVTVDPALYNLLAAAPTMYQALSMQYAYLQAQIEVIERLPKAGELDKLLSSLIEAQNAALMAQRIAQVGYESVANSLDKGSKRS
jgi:hypothetical protein